MGQVASALKIATIVREIAAIVRDAADAIVRAVDFVTGRHSLVNSSSHAIQQKNPKDKH